MNTQENPDLHEKRHAQILDAAGRCFADMGFRSTSMLDIVAECGASEEEMHRYYTSKEELIIAIVERGSQRYTFLIDAFEQEDDPVEALERVIHLMQAGPQDRDYASLVTEIMSEAYRNKIVGRMLLANEIKLFRAIEMSLIKGQGLDYVDPKLAIQPLANIIMTLIHGLSSNVGNNDILGIEKESEAYKLMLEKLLRPQDWWLHRTVGE